MRTAMGLIAGPESPPVLLAMRGRRVSTSMERDKKVLTSERASAPALSAHFAIWAMEVTLGESFTIRGRRETALARVTSWSRIPVSVPKTMPPCWVIGQEAFNSEAAMPSEGPDADVLQADGIDHAARGLDQPRRLVPGHWLER